MDVLWLTHLWSAKAKSMSTYKTPLMLTGLWF